MSFLAHKENGLLIKTSTVLSGVRHGFSTRTGGVSPPPWDSLNLGVGRGDDMDRVPGELPPLLCRAGYGRAPGGAEQAGP